MGSAASLASRPAGGAAAVVAGALTTDMDIQCLAGCHLGDTNRFAAEATCNGPGHALRAPCFYLNVGRACWYDPCLLSPGIRETDLLKPASRGQCRTGFAFEVGAVAYLGAAGISISAHIAGVQGTIVVAGVAIIGVAVIALLAVPSLRAAVSTTGAQTSACDIAVIIIAILLSIIAGLARIDNTVATDRTDMSYGHESVSGADPA